MSMSHPAQVAIMLAAGSPFMFAGLPAVAQPAMTFSGTSASDKPPASMPSTAAIPANAPDMQSVLDAQAKLGAKPIEALTPRAARKQPTPADGVKAVMKQRKMPTAPEPGISTSTRSYGAASEEKLRIYTPDGAKSAGAHPTIVYYHGGGWVIADLDTYDATPRYLAKQLNAIVVSVEYRHAPEAKFPAQHEDAALAYGWVLKNAKAWNIDPSKIALAGESAGGNLAVATAIYARDHQMQAPVALLSIYPIANSEMSLPAKVENGNTKPLNTAMLNWFTHYWARSASDVQDPRINLVKADLRGLPPTTIVNAQNDPLRSDGETLAAAMKATGVSVEQRTFPNVTHEFFGMGAVVQGAAEAEAYAVQRLKPALAAK